MHWHFSQELGRWTDYVSSIIIYKACQLNLFHDSQPLLAWSKKIGTHPFDCPYDAIVTYVPTAVGNREWNPPSMANLPFAIYKKDLTEHNPNGRSID